MMPHVKQEEVPPSTKTSGLDVKDDLAWHTPNNVVEAVPPDHPQHIKHQVPFNGLQFHNPFDVNSYPLTNPPLYDPTVMLPYGAPGPRRRRISISNGQIGQIVNHEAFFMDDDSLDGYYDSSGSGYRAAGPEQSFPDVARPAPAAPAAVPALPIANGTIPDVPLGNDFPNGRLPRTTSVDSVGIQNEVAVPQPQSSPVPAGLPPPNHSLIYNNEVIYNPNDGPIPGTAAWKKERLLERNRVAASKCRQRKKHAQQQLQNSMTEFRNELKEKTDKLQKLERILGMYNSALELHFQGDGAALETLRPLVNKSLDAEVFDQI